MSAFTFGWDVVLLLAHLCEEDDHGWDESINIYEAKSSE